MDASKHRAILFDMNLCAGCGKCVAACLLKQGFAGDEKEAKTLAQRVTDLSATSYTTIRTFKTEDDDELTYRNMCRHCVQPSCASVCPVGAIRKTELGPVTYEAKKCMGCRYCMTACPFNIPRYEWDNPVPAVRKCDMCYDRQTRGEDPACVEACPYGATIAGTREEMLEEARTRIADDPDSYHPHIYGEYEIGGTSVLFLSPFPLEDLGFDEALGEEPVPVHTWRVLSKIPAVAVTMGATMVALWWLTQRRDEVRAFEAARSKTVAADEGDGKLEENGRG